MKIVYITRGHGDYLIAYLNAMVKQADVYLVLAESDEWVAEHLDPQINVWFSKAPRVSKLGNFPAMFRTLQYIKEVAPDIVHIQSGVVWEILLEFMYRKAPFVLTVHDVTRHPSEQKGVETPQRLLDWAVKLSDALIVHGNSLQAAALERFGSKRPVFVSRHGIVTKYGSGTANYEPQTFKVIIFGRIDTYKGVEYLIAAEPLIRQNLPNIQIVIAGHTPNPDYYQKLVKDGQHIELRLRRQDDAEVSDLFAEADLLVLPYIEASQSGALQIGFAFGIPPVVTAVGGLPDVVQDGENGLLVPPRDPEALAQAITALLTDMDLRRKIIDGVVASREGPYNWDVISSEVLSIYEEIANNS